DAQPMAPTNAPIGEAATFSVGATNSSEGSTFIYQWRLNGVNLLGGTSSSYTTPPADLTNAGSYTVVVQNSLGAISTLPAAFTLGLTNVPGGDHFSNRVAIAGLRGTFAGQNRNATSEPGEPKHAKKMGGKSIWYTWQAPI